MELSKEIFEEITRLSKQGNELLDVQRDTSKAYHIFETALELLPEPANEWDAFAWLQSSLGECKYVERSYSEAYEHFRQAYNASAPNVNAFRSFLRFHKGLGLSQQAKSPLISAEKSRDFTEKGTLFPCLL